ncbi:branched-chain amino acid transport system ATP-binding protein [Carnobacterium iners]|uniref:Branched-chain amino acid transport system ATP-binding protein n=1 Tax=Carnobacterium iners TaxID=1073423 RepID=A0A1X7N7V5_9LACT|nr:ABC transporter ATP-binding protein [Carnobacterium iners]SEK46346.1 branched-chain amino acid transport system ATP-binding protein [Carnobacterium iners]SMH33079.1 branched-chain amino acid transport system ATP-binding protein [Carnobacterium iners]
MSLLEVKKLTKNFGGLAAVSMVSMELYPNELVGLIGPNGAGKTTLFNLLTGVYQPTEGSIDLEIKGKKQSLIGKKTYNITDMGLGRTFQNIRLFKNLTVLDNVLIGMHAKKKVGALAGIIRTPHFYQSEEKMKKDAIALLTIFNLEDKVAELAKNLPYGEQRRLEIVRALATKPKILFLDEPAAGMNPQETADLTALIRQIQRDFEITILLIEHDMSLVMNVCERIYVLEYGRMIAHGTPAEIKNNQAVIKAYLGGD